MPTPDQIRALETQIAPAAIASEALTGVPAELACAQCILESGWLTKMPDGSRNPFGLKASGPRDGVLAQTREWFNPAELAAFLHRGDGRTAQLDPAAQNAGVGGRRKYIVQDYFRRFEKLSDAFNAHSSLLLNGSAYGYAVKQFQVDHDLKAVIRAIAPVYATDPHYAESLEEIALSKEVAGICKALRAAA